MERSYYVYILSNKAHTVLYTGVTNDLKRRVCEHKGKLTDGFTKKYCEHKGKLTDGFTKKYKVNKLVYYEVCSDIKGAITREKQIKAGSRQDKIDLINSMNKKWEDMYTDL